MAAAAEAEASGSGSGGAADSYIGSLISLTSKSEIRYEGILFNINTEESSIGLRNVRSFGTEGRKKDGPQISPSDKVYEYILFRGSDIKDLQVKSSPPVPPTPPVHNDPAIIQSHYSQPASLSTSMPSVGSGAVADHNSHTAQAGFPRSTFQGGLPLYQPGGSLGAWGSPAHPNANGSGLPMPMYWQGFYGPSSVLPPHVQQQPLIRPPGPPPGLPIPHSMQQQMQYPGMNVSLSTGPQNLFEIPSLLPPVSTSSNQSMMSTLMSPSLPPVQTALLPSELSSSLMSSKIPVSSLPMATSSANLPFGSSLTSSLDASATLAPVSSKPLMVPASTLPHQPMLQSVSAIGGPSTSNLAETSVPLVTPGQLMQPGPSTVSLVQPLQPRKDEGVLRPAPIEPLPLTQAPTTAPVLDRARVPARSEAQAPILQSPTLLDQKMNGAALQAHHGNRGFERGRGRGRGNGISHSMTKFTEDFDFIAMNEKFKKDEVWGQIGRNNTQSRVNEGTSNDGDADDSLEEGDAESPGFEVKPVYVKDDFFDTLSSNALDRESRNGRIRFSEQRKIDSETFGDFPSHRGWGGRGRGRGGRSRGGYYGRGYDYGGRGHDYGGRGPDYGGRGRGRTMANRPYY